MEGWRHWRWHLALPPDPSTHVVVRVVQASGGGPNWAEIVTAVATAVAAFGLIFAGVGAILAWRGLAENSKARHAQISLELGKRWDCEATSKIIKLTRDWTPLHLDLYIRAKLESDGDEYYELERFSNFFEDVGVLYRLRILDLEWIDQTLGSTVIEYWKLWRMNVLADRPRHPTLYKNWQTLAEQLISLRNEPGYYQRA
jgi:hypothetical protein